jgi:uncharacterized membrane protein
MLGAERVLFNVSNKSTRVSRVLVLFVLGFFIVVLGIVILAVATLSSGGSASYGGVIFIGPIPIVFGAGPQAAWLILFAIVLAALSIIVFLLTRKRMDKEAVYSCFSSLP